MDHSVFQEGKGLLDVAGPEVRQSAPKPFEQTINRLNQETKHEQAVAALMEELEDQLDSDEDDQAYLVTKNSSTGGNDAAAFAHAANFKQQN